MTNDFLKIIAKFQKERKRIFNSKRKCFHPFCNKNAINSHVLQKNGYISRISVENHVYEHVDNPFNEGQFKFKRTGINEVFTFKGFCSYHDNKLFKDIETGKIDYSDYKTNLFFAYRILVQEIIKKENVIKLFKSLIEKKIGDPAVFQESIKGDTLGIKDAQFTLKKLLENINDSTKKEFTVHTREIRYLDICASGIYTFETTEEQLKMSKDDYEKPLTDILINILPIDSQKTIVLIVYLDQNPKCNKYYEDKLSLNGDIFIKFLSDILLLQMENWIISPSHYEKIKKDEEIISEIKNKALSSIDERSTVNYNIFK